MNKFAARPSTTNVVGCHDTKLDMLNAAKPRLIILFKINKLYLNLRPETLNIPEP